ncbi:MAG: ATP-binding protein [Myxococcota bacterium]
MSTPRHAQLRRQLDHWVRDPSRLSEGLRAFIAEVDRTYVSQDAKLRDLDDAGARLRAVLDGLPDSIYVVDETGTLVASHVTADHLPRVDVGDDLVRRIPDDRREAARAAIAEAFRTGEAIHQRFQRNGRHFAVSFSPHDEGYVTIIIRDVTEQEALQRQLVVTERMASLGTLAAGVAHEINNPLSYVMTNLAFAVGELERGGVDEEVLEALRDAVAGAGRVRDIVADLRILSRGTADVADPRPTDLGAVVSSAANIAKLELNRRALLDVEVGGLPPALAHEPQLVQVLLNLLVNAAQALPPGGPEAHRVRVCGGADGTHVWIDVEDDGPGIPPDVAERIFEPFYTTKPLGEGSGLGLSISRTIVERFGGELTLEAREVGACFRVRLRRAEAAAPSGRRKRISYVAPPPGASARVLVVDDEVGLGRALRRALREHDVEVVDDARLALPRILSGDFDFILCDLLMPHVTGMDIHDHLVVHAPGELARTVFMTGGAQTRDARAFLERATVPCLEKPLDTALLRAHLERALAKRAEVGSLFSG